MQTYKQLYRVATKYYENQHNEGGWCGVIACAVATGCAFGKARSLLFKRGRKNGEGSPLNAIQDTIEALGYHAEHLWQDDYRSRTLHTAMKEFAKRDGTWFVYSCKGKTAHVTCIKDGVVEDWAHPEIYPEWRMRDDRRKVYLVQKIIKKDA